MSNTNQDKAIFIIDDEEIIVSLITQLLEAAGFKNLHGFCKSTEVLELLRFIKPELIITDIHMPELSGTYFAKLVNEFPQLNKVPILAVTADDSVETRELAHRSGIYDVIQKPIDATKLISTVEAILKLTDEPAATNNVESKENQAALEVDLYDAFGRNS